MEKLFTPQEAADLLNVKLPTIRAWLHQHRLPRVLLGRSVRIKESTICQIIEGGLEAVNSKTVKA